MTKKPIKRQPYMRHIYAWLRENDIHEAVITRGGNENEYKIRCRSKEQLQNLMALNSVRVIQAWTTVAEVNLANCIDEIHKEGTE